MPRMMVPTLALNCRGKPGIENAGGRFSTGAGKTAYRRRADLKGVVA